MVAVLISLVRSFVGIHVQSQFGLENMGANYMLLWAGQFGTVVLLSQWLSSKVYEAHITKVSCSVRCLIGSSNEKSAFKDSLSW